MFDFLAILTTLAFAITIFINKIFIQKKYDFNIVTFVFYVSLFLVSLVSVIVTQSLIVSYLVVFTALLAAIIENVSYRVRLEALKYLSTSNFFINIRIFSSICFLFIGILFFNDKISINEYLGFFLGFVVLYLLIKDDAKTNSDLKKGMIYLVLMIVLIIVRHTNIKYVSTLYFAISFIFL